MSRLFSQDGFSLIELTIMLVVVGIVLAVAMQSMTVAVDDVRTTKTEREMETLARAITGDPSLTQDGIRSDFGYIGDNGSLPPTLEHLTTNVDGSATWDGPYTPLGYSEDPDGIVTDEWGSAYGYTGTQITSTGSGSSLTRTVLDNTADYLSNGYLGSIRDAQHNVPGSDYVDSVDIAITIPNGSGSMTTKVYSPDALGGFSLDSLPVGRHLLQLIYAPEADTLHRYITILPRHNATMVNQYYFGDVYFASAPSSPTTDTLTLRPIAAGDETNLDVNGAGANWQAVDDASSDGDGTTVERSSSSYATDTYEIEDPGVSSGTILSVTVYCVARDDVSGGVKPVVRYGGSTVSGSEQGTSGSYSTYSQTWTASPFTGSDWTWAEIVNLQAGLELKGKNSAKPAYCTQVWVEVEYES